MEHSIFLKTVTDSVFIFYIYSSTEPLFNFCYFFT